MAHYYCTLDDVKKTGITLPRIIELSNDSKAETVNEEIFNGCRQSAADLIDAYCLGRYSAISSFDPVPGVIVTIAAALTKYFLYERKNAVDDKIQKLYDNQIKQLTQISNGVIDLGESGQKLPQDSVLFTQKLPTDRVSHPDNLTGYIL